jgi:hypothetical protein
MSVLDRYRKPGGFVQLLALLETCGQTKKEKFLQMILEENANWHDALKQRLLSIDMVLTWPNEFLTEITSRSLPITLAAISKSLNEDQTKKLFHGLPHSHFSKIREISQNKNFAPMEITSSIEKFLGETRALIQQGTVKLDKFAPELCTPEDIEDQLAKKSHTMPPLPPPEVFASSATVKSNPQLAGSNSVLASVPPISTSISFSTSSGTGASPSAPAPSTSDEQAAALRRQNFQLQQELQQLRQENQSLKDKLDRIRKIA